jgi:hypothetical protein
MAIDPGRGRCGVAVCDPAGVRARAVVSPDELPRLAGEWQARYGVTDAVIGDRTGSAAVAHSLERVLTVPLRAVDEQGTTLRARARYFTDHPPRGWRRLVPRSLQTPPEPYDDYVAVLLAEAALTVAERGSVN